MKGFKKLKEKFTKKKQSTPDELDQDTDPEPSVASPSDADHEEKQDQEDVIYTSSTLG